LSLSTMVKTIIVCDVFHMGVNQKQKAPIFNLSYAEYQSVAGSFKGSAAL